MKYIDSIHKKEEWKIKAFGETHTLSEFRKKYHIRSNEDMKEIIEQAKLYENIKFYSRQINYTFLPVLSTL